MKKITLICIILLLGISKQVFAISAWEVPDIGVLTGTEKVPAANGDNYAWTLTPNSLKTYLLGTITLTKPATAFTFTPADNSSLTTVGAYGLTLTTTATTNSTFPAGTKTLLATDGSAASLTSFPTLNQDTSGTAAKATNMIGGNSTTLLGSIPYQSNTDTTTLLGPNTTTTKKFLRQTGNGTNGAAPAWDTLIAGDVPTLNQNTTGTAAGLSATLSPASGGTGIANNSASTLTISGNYGTTLTVGATTALTLPASGTVATLAGTETLTGKTITAPVITTLEVDGSAAASLTAAQVSSTNIYNAGQAAADVALTLPTAAAGYSFIANVYTARANKWGVRANTTDKIYLIAADGTVVAGADNGYARMTAAQLGQSFACWSFKFDSSTYDWMCKAISVGTSTFAAN